MASFIIYMDIGPFYRGELLQFDLQLLRDVVGNLDPLVLVDDHVDLGNQPRATVIGPHCVDLLYFWRMCHGYK
jgi:hypothetical protein